MGATEKIADWIAKTAYEDLPRQAVERAKRTALDTVAAALAGCTEPAATLITGYVKALDGSPQSGVIGSGVSGRSGGGRPGQWHHRPRPGLR